MESEARYAWIGGTLIALFVILAGGLYWLSGAKNSQPNTRYTVYFQKQSLEGLSIGSEVRMRGINVGRVADYSILADPTRGVRVLLEVDARIPVLEGALAEVNRKLVTGIAGVDLINTKADGIPLTRLPPGEPYPVIAEGVPEMARMAGVLEDLGSNGGEALQRINLLLSDDNQRTIAGTLANTRALTGHLAAAAPALRDTLEQSRRAAESLERVGVMAESTLAASGRQIDSLAAQSRDTLATARATLNTANTALERAQSEIGALSLSLRLSADLASQDLQATSKVLRDSGRAMQQSAQALSKPERILFGPPPGAFGPGENHR
ncbi:MAG: MlaD family protein [Pseudomonadota bacterium]|nr:MlaD family protein [Pseudomonadota bacterium]MDP1905110.1 MlaD family protein [Pseudomonadota bacterium]MDP2351966.1 MlaD family protein [Pseudomonadota bacterium]